MEIASHCKEIIRNLLEEIPPRHREVVIRRFGFERNGEKESLESIGRGWGITRERVRQIENRAIDIIKKSSNFPTLKKPAFKIENFINENGGLKREDILTSTLAPNKEDASYIVFVLRIGEPFFYQKEDSLFYSFWGTDKKAPTLAERANRLLIKIISKERKLFSKEELIERGVYEVEKTLGTYIPPLHLFSFIEVTKKIEENPFGEFGLAEWPEVIPKSVGDKAYLLFKKEREPFHFAKLAQALKETLGEEVKVNTLHNELIKDEKFVLIGRGVYALKEWGFKEGTVKEIIADILDKEGPLSKEEILERMKKQRLVKEATIFLNLRHFKKNEDGKYLPR